MLKVQELDESSSGKPASRAAKLSLARLVDLVRWLARSHNNIDPPVMEQMGDFFATFAQSEL